MPRVSDETLLASSAPGLCATCTYARTVTSAKGSSFLRCSLNDSDERFPRYPRLPVVSCLGFSKLSASTRPAGED